MRHKLERARIKYFVYNVYETNFYRIFTLSERLFLRIQNLVYNKNV